MTWHLGVRASVWAIVIAALCAAGCGSSGSKRPRIELIAPEDMAQLTIEDDIDLDLPGVQFDVKAQTQNIRADTIMLLVIPGDNNTAFFSMVDEEGVITFENATLPPGAHTFHISTANASVTSDEFSYTLKTLVIQSPRDGTGIAFGDDIDKDKEGLQVNVTVKSYAVDGNEDITLLVDDDEAGTPVSPDEGVAVFKSVTLSNGTHKLKAVSGDVESGVTTVSVNEACASVTFISPEVPQEGDRLTLGGGTNTCPANGQDFTVDFVISTDAGDGRDVELVVNNTTKQKTTVSGSLAKFEGIVLNRRNSSANEVFVTVQGAGGVTCAPVAYPKDIIVDCDGSSCGLGSPIPYLGDDGAGHGVSYLNKSMMNDNGFDIRVDSDSGVIGKKLQLIIDGKDGRNALSADAVPNGENLSATFSKVYLAEGEHTIEGRCTDGSGNVTETGVYKWVVDTRDCSIDIDSPAENALILPGDDNDSDQSNGVMVQLKANIGGADCVETRNGVCNPTVGILDGEFAELQSGSIDESVTLSSGADQQVCVEAKDRANNIARSSVPVKYRSTLPKVQIEFPANDTSFNAAGNADHSADSDTGTPACNSDFTILCTEIGGMVQLHRVDGNGPVIATGACEGPADSDPVLPSGFSGRARLNDVAFLPPGVDNATLVATQTVAGNSNQSLVGASDPVALTGWCQTPPITLYPGCPDEQLELPGGGGNVTVSMLRAIYNGVTAQAPEEAQLRVAGPGDAEIWSNTQMFTNGAYQFMNINLGNTEQTVETKLSLTDPYSNTRTITCTTTLVSDLPTLTITSPVSGASVGPSGGCNAMMADKFGIPVSLTLDSTSMRELSYKVNGGTSVPVTITGTMMSLCIPAGDGMNTIEFALQSTNGMGLAKPPLVVDVDTLAVTQPAQNGALLPADDYCDPGYGARVRAEVASIFDGVGVTVTAGSAMATTTVSSGAIDTCVQLQSGANTITVSLDGKNVSRSIDVSVVGAAPTHAIPITSVNLPTGNSYRTGSVSLGWNAPEQDFSSQLKAYELRCGATAIQGSASDGDKNTWWNTARVVSLASSVVPPATSSTIGLRIGESANCVLRARDAANQLTPIPDSTAVSYPFREVKVDVADINYMGYQSAAVGDVNDDGVNDVLIGGSGRAYLYFGSASGIASKTTPDVTFIGAPGIAVYDFGTRVAGLGDVNGDGENDFAIGHPSFSPTGPSIGQAGAVYFFYGRKNNDAWPATVDVSSTSATTCGADACFVGEVQNEFLGQVVSGAGDFNNDGRPDIAISAVGRPTTGMNADSTAGRAYVLLGRSFQTASSRPSQFWNVSIRLPSGDPFGFYVDGAGNTGTDATSSSQMGTAMAGVGNVDGTAGADLLLTAIGRSGPTITSKLLFMSGQTHNGSTPRLKQIATSSLQLKDSGAANIFALRLIPLRNLYDGSQSGLPDVAAFDGTGSTPHVYLGDQNGSSQRFANDTRLTISGPPTFGNGGLGAGTGYNPNLSNSSFSDLDGDGLDDLCVGSSSLAPVRIFYGNDVEERLISNQITAAAASEVNPAPRSGTTARSIQVVGDITGDGNPDLVMGEPNANSNNGGVTILY